MLTAIFVGVVGVLAIVLPLIVALHLAQVRLVPQGNAEIVVNEDKDKPLLSPVGVSLLDALARQGIIVPSACGGKGTCGTCKVRVTDGGGALLPTERSLVNRAEEGRGIRLACQVKVKGDLFISVPEGLLETKSWQCTVVSNRNVATYIKELVLAVPDGEAVSFRAGEYIQIVAPPHTVFYRDFQIGETFEKEWDRYDMWRFVSETSQSTQRAYSLANGPAEQGRFVLNVRLASPPQRAPKAPPGIVSSYLFARQEGDEVTVQGPFGDFFVKETDAEMMFLGGGAGMAPMRAHILDQLERVGTKRQMTFWYGARSKGEAFYVEEFDRLAEEHENFEWHLALSEPLAEDDWQGPTGFLHEVALENTLKGHRAPEDVEYYICGPGVMVKACEGMLIELGVDPENILYDDFG